MKINTNFVGSTNFKIVRSINSKPNCE